MIIIIGLGIIAALALGTLLAYKRLQWKRTTKAPMTSEGQQEAIKYHLVWLPKRRQHILVDAVAQYTKEVLQRIADEYEFRVEMMEVMEDHVHVFLEAPPKYSPTEVVHIMKSESAREVFEKFRFLRRQLRGELWRDGYLVRNAPDEVTAEAIRQYIEHPVKERASA